MKWLIIFFCLFWVSISQAAVIEFAVPDDPDRVVEIIEVWWGFTPETMIKVRELKAYENDETTYQFDDDEYQIPSYFGGIAVNEKGKAAMSELVLWNKFRPLKPEQGHIEYGVDREPPAIVTGFQGIWVNE